MLENIKLAFQGIVSHKLRSLLTMLGVIIGIASIITIVSTIRGTNEQIKQRVIGSGTNAVVVQLYQDDYPYEPSGGSSPDGVAEITEETRLALEDISGAEGASLFHQRSYVYNVFFGTKGFNGSIYGIDTHYFDVSGYKLCYGRRLLQSDIDRHMRVCFLDSGAVQSLLAGRNPIGEAIEISGMPFVVVGVVEKKNTTGAKINSLSDYYSYGENTEGKIFIPDGAWPIIYNFDEPLSAAIKAVNTDSMTRVGQRAADLLTRSQITGGNTNFSYRSVDLLEQAEQLQEMSSSNNRMLVLIACISLVVGGIGVMNIMLVSVTERTSEIGLKKAIGAKRRRILAQFLTEAGVLTGLGGVIGVVAGIIMSILMSKITGAPSSISVGAILVAIIISTGIGVGAGMIPAVKAANLNPIEALRRG